MFDMYTIMSNIFSPVLSKFYFLLKSCLCIIGIAVAVYLLLFVKQLKLIGMYRYTHKLQNSDTPTYLLILNYLESLKFKLKFHSVLRWVIYDNIKLNNGLDNSFSEYGFTIYCGRQGAGKTMAMVKYLLDMRLRYPNCIIVTNFKCSFADRQMNDWKDFMEIRNGVEGVIFAIDEIHSEYSTESWKDFPESLLSEISQQRKQRIKIVATSQVFSRVAKPIREQAFSVVQCDTYLHRYTRTREYDAAEYGLSGGSSYNVRKSVKPLRKKSFVQSNQIRSTYDTYEKIERMRKLDFIPRSER